MVNPEPSDNERPSPQPTSGQDQGEEGAVAPDDAKPGDQNGEQKEPRDPKVTPPEENSAGEPPQQTKQPSGGEAPEHGDSERGGVGVTEPGDEAAGNPADTDNEPVENDPAYVGQPVEGLEGGQPGTDAHQSPDPGPSTQAQDPGEGVASARSAAEPSHHSATAGDAAPSGRHPAVGDQSPEASSAVTSGPRASEASVYTAQPVGGQRQAEHHSLSAAGTAIRSEARLLLDPLWNGDGSIGQRAQEILRSVQDGTGTLAADGALGKGLTKRWPPPEVPAPFSGSGPMMGGATGSASSSNSGVPLFAVIVSCFSILLGGGRFLVRSSLVRPGTVPRLALERPG